MKRIKESELRVIRAIFSQKNATRIAIAQESRLSLVKVSSILNILEQEGYISKKGKIKSKSGRPSYIYKLRSELGCSIGISVKPDYIRFLAIDFAKELIKERRIKLKLETDPTTHIRSIVDQLSKELEHFFEMIAVNRENIFAIGIALPGMVDTRRRIWLQGLQMTGITHVNIAEELQQKFNIPIFIEDVARALAYQEKVLGYGQNTNNFILLYLDVGMGTGIVIDGKIYRGYHGIAGEIGHLAQTNTSYRCSCNNVGCLETVLSTPGILRIFKERLAEGVISILQRYNSKGNEPLSLKHILSAAEEGDRLAQTTLFEIGQYLGNACATLIKLFNPQRIIISGYVSILKNFLKEPMYQAIHRQVINEMLQDFDICYAEYSFNQEANGAALIAIDHFLENRLTNAPSK